MPPRLSSQRALFFNSVHACSRVPSPSNTRCLVSCPNIRTTRPGKEWSCSLSRTGSSRTFHASSTRSAPKDPYQILGVNKDASPAEVKKTYFALARKYHPDTNPDKSAQQKFLEIQEAYDILKDEKKRADYDKYGAASQQPGFDANAYENVRSAFGQGRNSYGFGNFQFRDLSSAFGGGRRGGGMFDDVLKMFTEAADEGQQFTRGGDIETTVNISFMEACKGTSRTVNITPVVQCDTCSGSGLKAGAKRSSCAECRGTGLKTFMLDNGFHMQTTCHACQGTGSTVPSNGHCGTCLGAGQVKTRKSVKVDIPAGVEDGVAINVSGQGDTPLGGNGRRGNLLVRINIASSRVFKRQGANLYHEAHIPLHTALLGGRVRVPTLDGEVDVRVPNGTQPGEQMVLKGRGVTPVYRANKGDLFVTFNVQLPRTLTSRQRDLLQQYADDVEGKTTDYSRQEPRQEPPRNARADETTSSGSGASTKEEAPAENITNEPPEREDVDKHKKRDQDRKKRATA